MPDLSFQVREIEAVPFAAVPTLVFKVEIDDAAGDSVQAVTLNTQVRIAAAQRQYSEEEYGRLAELFGMPGQMLKSLLWTHSVVHVAAFTRRTVVDLPITCTYDFEVVSAKYFHSVGGGWIPLELLFSGTVFWFDERGALQIGPISWDKEAHCRLPVARWKDLMDAYFPNSAWLRLQRGTFERLDRYRRRKNLPTWDAALDGLLRAETEKVSP